MKLPNIDCAEVSSEKITSYLLSESHQDGRHKAVFFKRFGFLLENWEVLEQVVLNHARQFDVVKVEASQYGTRYVIDGIINAPDGRTPGLRTVWFVREGEETPRFVTAYPLRSRDGD